MKGWPLQTIMALRLKMVYIWCNWSSQPQNMYFSCIIPFSFLLMEKKQKIKPHRCCHRTKGLRTLADGAGHRAVLGDGCYRFWIVQLFSATTEHVSFVHLPLFFSLDGKETKDQAPSMLPPHKMLTHPRRWGRPSRRSNSCRYSFTISAKGKIGE